MSLTQASVLTARIALFVIYFWFGLLKVIGLSPASPLILGLFSKTIAQIPLISIISFGLFIVLFGLFEMIIGILFVIPGKEKIAVITFFIHIITTTLPLIIISGVWTHFFVPTLEGQYIIKNLALVACALLIWASIPQKTEVETLTKTTI